MARQKMVSPSTTIWWVPTAGGPASASAMTSAQINAGVNLSCAIETGFKLDALASDKDASRTICDAGNVDNFTFDNYQGDLTFFRDNGINAIAAFVNAWNLLKTPGQTGYLVARYGKLSTVAAAVADVVSVFAFESDQPLDLDDAVAPIRFEVVFVPKGDMKPFFALAA
jgi:hypothetical protein